MKARSILNNHKKAPVPPFRRVICRHTHIVTILMAVALSLSIGILAMADSSIAQTVTTDPAADYQMWRDDEIFLPFYENSVNKLTSTSYEYNPDDSTLSKPTYCNVPSSSSTQMSAAAGRIMSPYYDQVIYASIWENYSLAINFADNCDLTGGRMGRNIAIGPYAGIGMPSVGTVANLPRFYDITTGDLDKHIDANLDYRDEVVVAYAGDTGNPDFFDLIVAVVDYTESSVISSVDPVVKWMPIENAIPRNIVSSYISYAAIPLAVSTGDFDGDTHKEIAVAYLNSTLTVGVAVFRYTTTQSDGGVLTHSLDLVQSITSSADKMTNFFNPTYFIGSIDAAAGDFDGDGKDELSVGATVFGKETVMGGALADKDSTYVDLKTFRFNDDLFITEVAPNTTANFISCPWGGTDTGVQIVTGLFKFVADPDPLKNYGLSRRQLVLAVINPKRETNLWAIVYDSNLVPDNFGSFMVINTYSANFSMAAGGFNGLRTAASPDDVVWSLAFSVWNESGQTLWLQDFDPNNGFFKGMYFTKTVTTTPNTLKTSIVPLIAYDHGSPKYITETTEVLAGDSMYLGAPLHMVLEGAYTFDYILQEPPKHVYWDAEHNKVENISGKDQFKLGTEKTTVVGVTNSYKDNFDKSWGLSESASGTISYGGGLIRPPTLEATLSETVGYDYTYHDATYDKNSETRTVTIETASVRDDAIQYRIQNIDVWRYYVYGANFEDLDDNPMVGFFDITGPTTVMESGPSSGMAALDIYQPVHELNNILSYPLPTAPDKYDPPDMGSFRVQCTDLDCYEPVNEDDCDCEKDPETGNLIQTIDGPLVNGGRRWTWGGISGGMKLSDNRSYTEGKERSTSKKLTASQDIKGTMRLKIPETTIKISASLDIAAHESRSWSDASTMETTTSELESINLYIPVGENQKGYFYYPTFYFAKDGTMRVSFAVDMPTPDSGDFWHSTYGEFPDPALNLPNRFTAWVDADVTKWDPYMGAERKLIRGFFVRYSEADEVTGEYTEYYGPPSAGDVVRLESRVYNYSIAQSVTALKVRFEYVEIDQGSWEEIGTREPIDDTTIQFLAPRGMETAAVNWQIPSFSDNESKSYKIYVVLDPDNDISNEKYETESAETRTYCPEDWDCSDPSNYIDPGQNNEGYRVVTVLASLPGAPLEHPAADVHLKSDALAAINPRGKLVTTTVQAYERRPLKIRVRIDTDYAGADNAHLLLFDGDPYDGKLIANKLSYTGDPDGNYVWIEWVPTELGLHRLYAKVVESTLDTNLGNNISDELKVVVIKAPKGPKKTPKGPKK